VAEPGVVAVVLPDRYRSLALGAGDVQRSVDPQSGASLMVPQRLIMIKF
jgi:hypothetical protein